MLPPDLPRTFEIYDEGSANLLATARQEDARGGRCRIVSCIRGNGALLTYYYGKGKRDVVIRTGANEGITAHLGTRWRGGRREWTLD